MLLRQNQNILPQAFSFVCNLSECLLFLTRFYPELLGEIPASYLDQFVARVFWQRAVPYRLNCRFDCFPLLFAVIEQGGRGALVAAATPNKGAFFCMDTPLHREEGSAGSSGGVSRMCAACRAGPRSI